MKKTKKTGWKEFVVGLLGTLCCNVSVLGCYPFIPAYFAAVYLQENTRSMISLGMLAGLVAFLPITAIAKYGMALLFIGVVIHLSEWVDKRCYTIVAAIAAAGGTLALTVFGGIFDMKNQISVITALLEALFIFGFVIIAARLVHIFLEEKEKPQQMEHYKDGYQEKRLRNYAKSFEGLSKTVLSMSSSQPFRAEETGRMQQEITGRICSSCDACAICWEPTNPTMYQIFGRLFQGYFKDGGVDEEVTEELSHHCQYAEHVSAEASNIFEKARMNRAWYNRLLENREVIAQQLDAMAFIMQDCASESRLLDYEEKRKIAEIRYQAKELGIVAEEIHLYEKNDHHMQLFLNVHSRRGNCIAVKQLTKVITGVLQLSMRPHKDDRTFIGKEVTELVYEEEPVYHVVTGVAKYKKDGASISGDSFSFLEKEDGEVVLSLSDGMGSGLLANKESEMVIELLEKFIEAGFSKETAIRMLNSAMVIRSADERYSTVDVSSIDLYTGETQFHKIGASATFIRHKNGEVEWMCSASLPVGVSCELEIWKEKKELSNGDFLVMITDGVIEYLNEKQPEQWIADKIAEISTNHSGLLAKKLLESVVEKTGGEIPDDMTVLTAGIWENA